MTRPDPDPDHVHVLAAQLHTAYCHPGLLPFPRCSIRHRDRDERHARTVLAGLNNAGYQLASKRTFMTKTNHAPYPTRSEDVSAERLAAHCAVAAQRRWRANEEAAELDRTAMSLLVQQWGVVFLLREMQERAGTHVADSVALALWEAWNDGSHLGEMLWEWLTEYGIDPEAVSK